MIDRARALWAWLDEGTDTWGGTSSLKARHDSMTSAEHVFVVVARIAFAFTELALFCAMFVGIPFTWWLFGMVLHLPTPGDIIAALASSGVAWLFLRKGHALLRGAVFDALERRVARRDQREDVQGLSAPVVLDATGGGGGSPVAVSVDVDHGDAHAVKERWPRA